MTPMITGLFILTTWLISFWFIFIIGMWYQRHNNEIAQQHCKHEFRIYRVCKKCELKQREVKE